MPVIWTWLRNPKNLAVLTALGSAIGYTISIITKPATPIPPQITSPQPAVVVSPQIHIENNPSNTANVSPQIQAGSAQIFSREASNPPQARSHPMPVPIRLPVRRHAGAGIPVDIIPGFSITVASIMGFDGRFKVELESELWGGQRRTFPVGARPVDITIKGRTYQLSVEATDGQLAEVLLAQARP